ncbi:MAG TPA: hypothetical protein P5572_19955, partial [Phycisphaerae bacterium]|nr:hypothetical protein [Phycisphaerae bacterium]
IAGATPPTPQPGSSGDNTTLRAQRIEVVNAAGQIIFSVGADAAGGGTLALNDANAKPVVQAGRGDFGQSALAICAAGGKASVLLSGEPEGGQMLLISSQLVPRLIVRINDDGESEFVVPSPDGTARRQTVESLMRH